MERVLSPDRIIVDQNRRISETITREQGRLRQFIRKHVRDDGDAEDIFQEVFYELIETYRLMKPVEQVGAWLFRVARNRIIDLFRARRPAVLGNDSLPASEDGEEHRWEDLLPSPDAGPEAAYACGVLLEERELSDATGVGVNTLLSRKRYAVLQLRRRLQAIHEEFGRK